MMEIEDIDALAATIGEGVAKLGLIHDYIDRFEIKDMRIIAPILDIERVLCTCGHVVDVLKIQTEEGKNGNQNAANY